MKKILILLISIFCFVTPAYAYSFDIKSDKLILINLNEDTILYEKNIDDKTQIASLTKIITAITVIENISDLESVVTITSDMLKGLDGYAKLGFKVGDKVTVHDLLYALMLPSAADAAQALAIYTSGSIDEFAVLMNNQIAKIGVKNSHFSNPVGMDDDMNYSTASDLAEILKYSLQNETFKTIFETNKYHINNLNIDVKKTLANTSINYKIDTNIIKGAKTGFTYDAGMCLASTSSANNVDYLIVALNAEVNSLDHIYDTVNLYKYYEENYQYKKIMSKNQLLTTLKVENSKTKELSFYADIDKEIYAENSFDLNSVKLEYEGISKITNKNKNGDKLGTINFIYNSDIIYTYDIYLKQNIKYYNFIPITIIGVLVITFIIFVNYRRKRRKKRKCKK